MPLRHRVAEVVHRLDRRLRGRGELVHPRVPRLDVLDLGRLVAAPRGADLRPERLFRDREVVLQRIDRIVGRAHDLDVGLLHETARGEALPRKLRVALLPDALRALRVQYLRDAEIAGELEVRPVEERVADEALHRLGELHELVVPRRVARAEALLDSVGAHLAPLVVVTAKPDLRDVGPALVLRDLHRREMAVVVDDGHLLRMAVV